MQPIRDFSRGAGSELVGSMEHCLCDGRPCDWFTGTHCGLLLHKVKALTQVEMPVGGQGLYGSFLTLDGAERWAAMLPVFVSFTDTTLLSCPTRSSIEAPWFSYQMCHMTFTFLYLISSTRINVIFTQSSTWKKSFIPYFWRNVVCSSNKTVPDLIN